MSRRSTRCTAALPVGWGASPPEPRRTHAGASTAAAPRLPPPCPLPCCSPRGRHPHRTDRAMPLDAPLDPLPAEPRPGSEVDLADPPTGGLSAEADDDHLAEADDDPAPRRARRLADRFPSAPQVPGSASGAVVWVAVALILALLAAAGFWPAQMTSAADAAMQWVTTTGGWSLLLIPLCLIALLLVLACTRFGDLRLGPDDSRPEYPTFAWIAMLLGAVMGIGMVTYGVAEPVSHLVTPPHGL